MKKILISLIISAIIAYSKDYGSDVLVYQRILSENNLDINSKSYRGWMRLFNSADKLDRYHIYVSEKERISILKVLKELRNNKVKLFSKRVK